MLLHKTYTCYSELRLKREREEASKVVDKVPTPVPVKAMNLVIKNAAPGAVVDGKEVK